MTGETNLDPGLEVLPDPARTIEGLRDTGYTVETALADIVDNSIAAEASVVVVDIFLEADGSPVVRVADDGYGLDRDGVIDAMKYGSSKRPDPKSLGKFGLGLKTASTAICRSLTLTSRTSDSPTTSAQWDLDYVAETGKWFLRTPEPDPEDVSAIDAIASDASGTVVTWRRVDRLLSREYQKPTGGHAQRAIEKIAAKVRDHFSVTYVKFLDPGQGPAPNVSILVNSERVLPWDPLGQAVGSEIVFETEVPVELDDGSDASFTLKAAVLPPRSALTDEQEKEARISAGRAGFYVFREDRCISQGGWLDMYAVEPHASLCRIEFAFDHGLDDAFQIDIKKSRIEMLHSLWEFVKQEIKPARQEAERRYRRNVSQKAVASAPNIHAPSNNTIHKNVASLSGTEITPTGPDEVELTNARGRLKLKLPVRDVADADAVHIEVEESLEEGMLFRPGLVGGRKAVLLNGGHPFYDRCYGPESTVTTQAVDFLLWSLAEAELQSVTAQDEETLVNMRRIVTRLMRQLAEQLPEPD